MEAFKKSLLGLMDLIDLLKKAVMLNSRNISDLEIRLKGLESMVLMNSGIDQVEETTPKFTRKKDDKQATHSVEHCDGVIDKPVLVKACDGLALETDELRKPTYTTDRSLVDCEECLDKLDFTDPSGIDTWVNHTRANR
jgi:hypothetical protein